MYQQGIGVVDIHASLPTFLQREGRLIAGIETPIESSEKSCHCDVHFAMSVIHRGVDQIGRSAFSTELISGPEVTME